MDFFAQWLRIPASKFKSFRMGIGLLLCLIHSLAHAGINTGLVGDDVTAGPFPIGFTFTYYGQNFTTFNVTTNGLVQFSSKNYDYSNSCLPSGLNNTLFVFWDDLRTDVAGQPAGKIQYETIGEAPNRKLVVQWTNQYFFGSNLPMGTFQTVLFEGTNEIKFQYRYLLGNGTGASATIGIQGPSSQYYSQYGCNQALLTAEKAISFLPDATGMNYQLNSTAAYEFFDISNLTPDPPAVLSTYVNTSPSWTWGMIPELNTYQIEIQTEAGATVHTQTVGNVGSYTWDTGFTPGTTYRAKVRGSINGGATWELWSGLSQPVTVDQTAPSGQMMSAMQTGATSVLWRFMFTDELSGADKIRLQIASDAEFQNLVFDALIPVINSYSYSTAIAGQHLYGRIEVTDRAGNVSPYSNVADVLVIPAPTADFTPSTSSGEAPLDVTFENTTTGTATSYLWNFGDGRTSSATHPTMRFSQAGTFNVTLRATNLAGWTEASKTITVTPDVTAPVVGSFTVNGLPAGTTLTPQQTETLVFAVTEAGGVQTMSATLAGQPLAITALGNGSYSLALDPTKYANGTYSLQISVLDTAGNLATTQIEVVINLPPPPAPVLTAPTANLRTNQTSVLVKGTTPTGSSAKISVNGVAQTEWLLVANQKFEGTVTLTEGLNHITAVVSNLQGESAPSADLLVTLDTSQPNAPTGLSATSQALGKVRLSWVASTSAASVGTIIYRSTSAFDDVTQASRLTPTPLKVTSYDDLPPADGNYFYRVASVNDLGTLSLLSNSAQASADTTPPRALSIVYTALGKTDPVSGRIGQGRVNLTLTVSESLQSTPYLSVVPQGSVLIPVELVKVDTTTYSGSFYIDAGTGSGVANALFSARDLVGNRGTDIDAGATLAIDTQGPVLSGIAVTPGAPIKNDPAQTVEATFTLTEAAAGAPQVTYLLSGTGREPVAVTGLTAVNDTTWTASVPLPSDAGQGSPETLSFRFHAMDDLDNVSTQVTAPNSFQVYQGELPPVATPWGFTAKAQPGGKVSLSWEAVEEASAYQLYRQGPSDSELLPLTRVSGVTHLDQTPQDGAYRYTVASVRQSNGQESLSAQSAPVDVVASATAPGAPENLSLQLTGQGIVASWQPPLASTVASYNLYRAAGTSITSTEGLTPYKTGIKLTQALDSSPSPTQGAYAVTALDAAGNESLVSNSAYLNASLLPVRNLHVTRTDNGLPILTWDAPNSSVAGYLVYVGPQGAEVKLTESPITARTYTDTGYTTGERRYTVAAVDANGVEMPRSVSLPSLMMQMASGLPIKRGLMNRVQVQVANASSTALNNVRVVVRVPTNHEATQFLDHKSDAFALNGYETRLVPVVVGGYTDMPAPAPSQVSVEITPNEGELVKVSQAESLDVGDGSLVVGMATENFTRGATGKVRLTVENTSEVDVELLTAVNNGAGASPELRFKLLDADGNVLATQAYKQTLGVNVITLSNGQTVARIPAGASYVSDVFDVNVPASSPTNLRVKLEVDKLRYHTGQSDQILITGRGSEKSVTLVDTAYVGEVTDVTPVSSFGDENVIITGRALDRATNAPLSNTRLKLVLNQQGFERTFSVLTDAAGGFVYTFVPTYTDGGFYKVCAVHPDVTDRPEQKSFTINRVTVTPTPYRLDVPKNYPFSIPFVAKAGPGTAATNLRFVVDPAAQPTGQWPAGVTVDLPAPVSLTERQMLNVPVRFTANNDAPTTGSVILDVVSDERAEPLGRVRVDYKLSDALPSITSTPSFVETGLAQGSSQLESLTVENKGLQAALNLRFSLTNADGTPAPNWVALASQADGTLAIGEKRSIDISFTPPVGTDSGVYEFKLNVQGDNVAAQSLNVYASVTQSGTGDLRFKVADIYTGTYDKNGQLIEGLAGATILVQNEDVATETYQLTTDSLGEAFFDELPAGRYAYRARASNHQEIGGRLQVKPGIEVLTPLFLEYNLVTVEWSVREITIQDRYEITLSATFETDVPAPVVVMQPASVNLPKMASGDVYYGELTLTNYGLVRVDNVKQRMPNSDANFRFEFLAEVPPTLEAKQHITIPYRVVALQSLDGSGTASGGGCYSYSNSTGVNYSYVCANGSGSNGSASSAWFASDYSTCPTGTGGGGGGGGGGFFGGGGSFGGGSMTSTPLSLPGKKCVFVPDGKGCS